MTSSKSKGLMSKMNQMDIQSENQFSITTSQAQAVTDYFAKPNTISNQSDHESDEVTVAQINPEMPQTNRFSNLKEVNRAAFTKHQIDKKMQVLKGAGLLPKQMRGGAGAQLTTMRNYYKSRPEKELKPHKPYQHISNFGYYQIAFNYDPGNNVQLNALLVATFADLSLQGCKYCSGFGHSTLKCPTGEQIKHYGAGISFLRQALKIGLQCVVEPEEDELQEEGEEEENNWWQYRDNVFAYMQQAIDAARDGVEKQAHIAYQTGLKGQFALLSVKICNCCGGFGHTTAQSITVQQRSKETNKLYFDKERVYCPTKVTIEKRLHNNSVAMLQYRHMRQTHAGTEISDYVHQITKPLVEGQDQVQQPAQRPAQIRARRQAQRQQQFDGDISAIFNQSLARDGQFQTALDYATGVYNDFAADVSMVSEAPEPDAKFGLVTKRRKNDQNQSIVLNRVAHDRQVDLIREDLMEEVKQPGKYKKADQKEFNKDKLDPALLNGISLVKEYGIDLDAVKMALDYVDDGKFKDEKELIGLLQVIEQIKNGQGELATQLVKNANKALQVQNKSAADKKAIAIAHNYAVSKNICQVLLHEAIARITIILKGGQINKDDPKLGDTMISELNAAGLLKV